MGRRRKWHDELYFPFPEIHDYLALIGSTALLGIRRDNAGDTRVLPEARDRAPMITEGTEEGYEFGFG